MLSLKQEWSINAITPATLVRKMRDGLENLVDAYKRKQEEITIAERERESAKRSRLAKKRVQAKRPKTRRINDGIHGDGTHRKFELKHGFPHLCKDGTVLALEAKKPPKPTGYLDPVKEKTPNIKANERFLEPVSSDSGTHYGKRSAPKDLNPTDFDIDRHGQIVLTSKGFHGGDNDIEASSNMYRSFLNATGKQLDETERRLGSFSRMLEEAMELYQDGQTKDALEIYRKCKIIQYGARKLPEISDYGHRRIFIDNVLADIKSKEKPVQETSENALSDKKTGRKTKQKTFKEILADKEALEKSLQETIARHTEPPVLENVVEEKNTLEAS